MSIPEKLQEFVRSEIDEIYKKGFINGRQVALKLLRDSLSSMDESFFTKENILYILSLLIEDGDKNDE